MRRLGVAGAAVALGVGLWWAWPETKLGDAEFAAFYATPLPAPVAPVTTYHLGHSLVGRDMPAMLGQLAGHSYASQLGWGTSLRDHWNGTINGFDSQNEGTHFRPAKEALASGDYDVVVLTEMVEIRDAIRYHDSANALADWALAARAGNQAVRVYLYETWHSTDDPEGWLTRLDADLDRYWKDELLRPAMAQPGVGPLYVIPAGQVMAATARAIAAGEVPGVALQTALFATNADGTPDTIHLSDLGAYLIALTHYAVIYQKTPVGLPHDLRRADGTPADAIAPETARALQELVWQTVGRYALTGHATAQK